MQRRESRTLYCTASIDALRELIDYLLSDCRTGNLTLPELPQK